jgi:hypothetical protein
LPETGHLHQSISRFLHQKQPATLTLALVITLRRDGWNFRPGHPELASNHREQAICINPSAAFSTTNNRRHSLSRSSELSSGTDGIFGQDTYLPLTDGSSQQQPGLRLPADRADSMC